MIFSENEVARFHFIDDQHPADFVLYKGTFKGTPVAVLVWADEEDKQLRPWAIILNDEIMQDLQFEQAEVVREQEEEH